MSDIVIKLKFSYFYIFEFRTNLNRKAYICKQTQLIFSFSQVFSYVTWLYINDRQESGTSQIEHHLHILFKKVAVLLEENIKLRKSYQRTIQVTHTERNLQFFRTSANLSPCSMHSKECSTNQRLCVWYGVWKVFTQHVSLISFICC